MSNARLILGTYNSQPWGICDAEIEQVYQDSYKPFLSLMYNYPSIAVTLYYSGTLLKWFQDKHPEFLMLLNEMIKRKQIELIGGGFYEPVFAMIPARDRTGQIEKLTTYIRKRFGTRPRGIWIPERIWEPNLPITLNSCGMEYTFLDEKHLLSAGLRGAELRKPCLTEDQGKLLTILPIIGDPLEFITKNDTQPFLTTVFESEENTITTVMLPGEKLGSSQVSSSSPLSSGALKELLDELNDRRELKVTTPRDALRGYGAMSKVYVPCASHEDMMHWVLNPDHQQDLSAVTKRVSQERGKPFIAGGFFRQFLGKYPESNFLYSKMMNTHVLVNQVRGDRSRKKTAREELWKGESNAPYWHGRTGGLYRNDLRKSAYRSLIEAERLTRERGIFKPSMAAEDFDMDGLNEYVYRGYELNAYIHSIGGVLFELDYLPKCWNYLDSCSRHLEPYHASEWRELHQIECPEGLLLDGAAPPVDRYQRRAFIDHFFRNSESLARFDLMEYNELGSFVDQPYTLSEIDRERHRISLFCEGLIQINGSPLPVRIEKKYSLMRTSVNVFISITNSGPSDIDATYGTEINISPDLLPSQKAMIYRVDKNKRRQLGNGRLEALGVPEVVVDDPRNEVSVSMSSADEFDLWGMPLETITLTTEGITKLYQSSTFVLRYPLRLQPGESWSTRISLRFDRIK